MLSTVSSVSLLTLLILGRAAVLASAASLTFYTQPCNVSRGLDAAYPPSPTFQVPGLVDARTNVLMDLDSVTGKQQFGIFVQAAHGIGLYLCPMNAEIARTDPPSPGGQTLKVPGSCVPKAGAWTCNDGNCCQMSGLRYSIQSLGGGSEDRFDVALPAQSAFPSLLGADTDTAVAQPTAVVPSTVPTSVAATVAPLSPADVSWAPVPSTSPTVAQSGASVSSSGRVAMLAMAAVSAALVL
ncbi:hypothetical protein HKX48_005670 [Thoreauomyces humboldtii]|nr:hypothetical protein HKX48_005670 [Thoreauomyces humboldtii]